MATPVALTIAGSDPSGGAGIQADLKTFAALGVYGASVVTALTAQNTQGVTGIHQVPSDFVTAQMDAVFSDLDVGAVKIGMVAHLAVIDAIATGHHARGACQAQARVSQGRYDIRRQCVDDRPRKVVSQPFPQDTKIIRRGAMTFVQGDQDVGVVVADGSRSHVHGIHRAVRKSDVVEDVVSRKALGLAVKNASYERLADTVVVEYPCRQTGR